MRATAGSVKRQPRGTLHSRLKLCKTIFETCEIQELIYEVDGVSFNQ